MRTIDVPAAIEGVLYDMSKKQEEGYSPEAILSFSVRRLSSIARQIRYFQEANKKRLDTRKDILEDIKEDVL